MPPSLRCSCFSATDVSDSGIELLEVREGFLENVAEQVLVEFRPKIIYVQPPNPLNDAGPIGANNVISPVVKRIWQVNVVNNPMLLE